MDNIETKAKARPYRDNEALRRAQKRYYENNKEKKLEQSRTYYKSWLESPNIDEVKAKRKQTAKLRYERNKPLQILTKEDKQQPVKNPLFIIT